MQSVSGLKYLQNVPTIQFPGQYFHLFHIPALSLVRNVPCLRSRCGIVVSSAFSTASHRTGQNCHNQHHRRPPSILSLFHFLFPPSFIPSLHNNTAALCVLSGLCLNRMVTEKCKIPVIDMCLSCKISGQIYANIECLHMLQGVGIRIHFAAHNPKWSDDCG